EEMAIYFRDLNAGTSLSIHHEEKFVPASLNKVPMMMHAYRLAEDDPEFLGKTFTYTNPLDANNVQLIKPKQTLYFGQTYTLDETINTLITYSDNASYNSLTSFLSYDEYVETFNHLKIPI